MANLIWELGADSSGYRNDLQSLPAATESSFRRITQSVTSGSEKSTEGIKSLQHGMRELKELVLAGGAVELVKRFFDAAGEAAGKSTNAFDDNAAAVLRFRDSTKGAGEAFGDFAVRIVGTTNRMGELFGGVVRDAWDYWIHGATTAAGVTEQAERGARAAALALDESRKHASEWNQVNQEGAKISAEREKIERNSLSLSAQRAELEAKQTALLREYSDVANDVSATAERRLDARRKLNEAAQLGNDLAEIDAKLAAEANKQLDDRRAKAAALYKAQLDAMDTTDRVEKLTGDIAALEGILRGTVEGTNQARTLGADLEEKKLLLQQAQLKASEEESKILNQLEKAKFAALPVDEKILTYQQSIATLQDVIAKGKKDHVNTDFEQLALLQNQSDLNALLATQEEARGKAQHAITEEIRAQLDLLNHQNDHNYLLDSAKKTYQFNGKVFAGDALPQEYFDNLSKEVLQEIIRRARTDIADLESTKYSSASSGAEAVSGFVGRGEAEAALNTNIIRAQAVLDRTSQLSSADYGTALKNFSGPLDQFESAYRTATNSNTSDTHLENISLAITQVNQRLAAAGFGIAAMR